ncbi:hypothetical protein VP1G_09392 [Cytospora mali]|uniref:Uncharacterized protein n=1 Tax=Cytospora mali TaxID=578113 RepID=A0A194VE36_CYTMA|nr:hypothetical protein VP1G_09392 [Valsa mali var. pyri (nom. inval.)]
MSFGDSRKQLGLATVTIPGQNPFIDHTSTEGLSAYIGRRLASSVPSSDTRVLPPLFSFQVYITYGSTLADAPSPLICDYASRAMAEMNKNDQFEYPIRFDFHFLPGRDVNGIISHYRAEGSVGGRKALIWLLFDPPAEYLQAFPEQREAILGNGVSDDGVLVTSGVSVQQGEWNSLSVRLRTLAESNDRWTELKNQYDEAVLRGRTEW